MTEVTFDTTDGVTISASFSPGSNNQAVILAHMLSRDRNVWGGFPDKLNQKGHPVLNIDLRGHGRPINQNGQTISFQNFSELDFNQMPLDLAAAKDYLIKQGIASKNIYLIGASIGANAALVAASADHAIRALVLLSPGENYHGVKTYDAAKAYAGRPALIVSSSEDTQSYNSSQILVQLIGLSAKFIGLSGTAHGTALFDSYTTLQDQIISFLTDT